MKGKNEMKKCNKFKEYFIFSTEEKLKEHIENCPECKAEYEEFEKVSSLVKEVKAAYKEKKKNNMLAKVACFSTFVLFSSTFGLFGALYNYSEYTNYENYLQDSVTEEMGYPIDNYGLIKVD